MEVVVNPIFTGGLHLSGMFTTSRGTTTTRCRWRMQAARSARVEPPRAQKLAQVRVLVASQPTVQLVHPVAQEHPPAVWLQVLVALILLARHSTDLQAADL